MNKEIKALKNFIKSDTDVVKVNKQEAKNILKALGVF